MQRIISKTRKEEIIKSFITSANIVHNHFYDYSLINADEYIDYQSKFKIICPIHGMFEQLPNNHIRGSICPECSIINVANKLRMGIEKFVNEANIVHKKFYDYSLIDKLINSKTKIRITCPIHGVFEQIPANHLQGAGCPKCGHINMSNKAKIGIEKFIERSNIVHKKFYDYSLIDEYINNTTKVKIICPIHGEFMQTPKDHLKGSGCALCGALKSIKNRKIYTNVIFIKEANKIHNNKYTYPNLDLGDGIRKGTKVIITCPIHGDFKQTQYHHLNGHGCRKCVDLEKMIEHDEYIKNVLIVHNYKYTYPNAVYKGSTKEIEIYCPKHGYFWQNANAHLSGSGCIRCSESTGEKRICKYLDDINIIFIRQKTFPDCKRINVLRFDFYLPGYNICIEFNGEQHYKSIPYWGGKERYKISVERDKIKSDYCHKNNIKLIIIHYKDFKNIESILEKELKLKIAC